MKVKDVIRCLSNCNPDAEVHISYAAGDYWRTQLAPQVSDVDEGQVVRSDYHGSFKLIEDDERERELDEGDKTIAVVVIR